jgi:hypothetical protein
MTTEPGGSGVSPDLEEETTEPGTEAPTTDTADAIARLRSAWKTTLAREGKLRVPDDD